MCRRLLLGVAFVGIAVAGLSFGCSGSEPFKPTMLAEGSTIIGPEGGQLDVLFEWLKYERNGEQTVRFRIEFPAGAVTQPTEVSAEIWREQVRGVDPITPVVHLKPEGFQSEKRLKVILPFTRAFQAAPRDEAVMLHRSTQTKGALEAVGFGEHIGPDGLVTYIHNFSTVFATNRNRMGFSQCSIGYGAGPAIIPFKLNVDDCQLFAEDTTVGVEVGISEWGSATLDDCRQPLTSLVITTNQTTNFVQLERVIIEPIRNVWGLQILSWDFTGADMNVIPSEDFGRAAFETRRFDANLAFPDARVPFWSFGPMGFEVWPEDDNECLVYRALIDVKPLGGTTTTIPITYDSCARFEACNDVSPEPPGGSCASWTADIRGLQAVNSSAAPFTGNLSESSNECSWTVRTDNGYDHLFLNLGPTNDGLTIGIKAATGAGTYDLVSQVSAGRDFVGYSPIDGANSGLGQVEGFVLGSIDYFENGVFPATMIGSVTIEEDGSGQLRGSFNLKIVDNSVSATPATGEVDLVGTFGSVNETP